MRPPIGFIVEGHGEFNCYPSLFSRIVNDNNTFVPLLNAGGCGTIVKRLKEQLTDIQITYKPLVIVVTIDLVDVIDQGLFATCVELVNYLDHQVAEWIENSTGDARLNPLPNRVVNVIQIKKFETWMISDIQGLKEAQFVSETVPEVNNADEIASPTNWLNINLQTSISTKSPADAKSLFSVLDPARMVANSKSFDKFHREVTIAYQEWLATLT